MEALVFFYTYVTCQMITMITIFENGHLNNFVLKLKFDYDNSRFEICTLKHMIIETLSL